MPLFARWQMPQIEQLITILGVACFSLRLVIDYYLFEIATTVCSEVFDILVVRLGPFMANAILDFRTGN